MALNNLGLGFNFEASDNASGTMDKVGKKLEGTKGKAKEAKVSLEKVGGELESMGTKMQLAGAAGIAVLGLSAHEASKFEFNVSQIATEADKTKLPMNVIADITKKMATTYGGDLETQTKAMYQAVAAGADTAAKSIDIMNAANQLAIAGNTTQETALLGLTKVLNNYGLGFEHASEVSDAFFVAVRNGQTTVGELGDAIGQVAAMSKNAGLSMEEMIGAMGTAATLGKDTAGSAAAMKAALSGIAHPTAEAAAEAAKLGIKFDSATLRSMGLVKFLKQITGSAKYSADSMNQLFGSVEGAGFMAQLAANDMSALNGMMEGMAGKSGGAKEATDLMSATLQQQASILKANLQVALVEVGEALMPLIKEVVAFGTSVVKWFTQLPKPVKTAFAAFLGISSVLLVVGGTLATVIGGVIAAAGSFEVIGIAVLAAVGLMGQLVVIFGVFAAVLYAWKAAYDKNLGGFADLVDKVVTKVRLAFDALGQLFGSGQFSGQVLKDLQNGNQGIMNFAITAFMWFNRIKNFFEGMSKGFEGAMLRLQPVFKAFVAALTRIGEALGLVKEAPDEAGRAFDSMGNSGYKLGSSLGDIFGTIVTVITAVANGVGAMYEMWNKLSPVLIPLKAVLGDLFGSFGQLVDAFGGSQAAGASTTTTFEKIGKTISVVVSVIVGILTVLIGIFSAIVSVVAVVVSAVIDLFTGLMTFFSGFYNVIAGLITGDLGQVWLGLRQMVLGATEVINAALLSILGPITAVIDKMLSLVGLKSNLTGGLKSFLGGGNANNAATLGLDKGGNPIGANGAALPAVGAASPSQAAAGAAAGGGGGGSTAVTSTINVKVGEEQIATVVEKQLAKNNQRSNGPTATQT